MQKSVVEEDTLQENIHMIIVSGGKQEKQMAESNNVIQNFPKFHFLEAARKNSFTPIASRPKVNPSPFDVKREHNLHTNLPQIL